MRSLLLGLTLHFQVSGWIYGCTVATSLLSWFVAYFWFTPSYVLEQLNAPVDTNSMPAYASYGAFPLLLLDYG